MSKTVSFPGGGPPPGSKVIDIPGASIGVWGVKAEYHIKKHKEKLQKYHVDCGIDLYGTTAGVKELSLSKSLTRFNVGTGVHFILPPGTYGQICDRGSTPITLHGASTFGGVIDPFYTGEINIHLQCLTADRDEVWKAIGAAIQGEVAIAQLIPTPFYMPIFNLLPSLPHFGLRDSQGYGSTNHKLSL